VKSENTFTRIFLTEFRFYLYDDDSIEKRSCES